VTVDVVARVAAAEPGVVGLQPAPDKLRGGNNLGLRQERGPYVVLLNDDGVVQRGWLRALLEPFADATAGAVAGKLLLEPRFVSVPLRAEGVDRLGLVSVTRDGGGRHRRAGVGPAAGGGHRPAGCAGADPRSSCEHHPGIVRWDVVLVPGGVQGRCSRRAYLHLDPALLTTSVVGVPAGSSMVLLRTEAARLERPVRGTVLTRDGYAADRGFGRADDTGYDMPAEVFAGCGASLALRTAALRQVGLSDDAWLLYYEDVDLCWRLRRAGWTFRYQPRAVARHEHSATVRSGSNLDMFHDARNCLLTLTKNASFPLVRRSVGRYLLSTAAGWWPRSCGCCRGSSCGGGPCSEAPSSRARRWRHGSVWTSPAAGIPDHLPAPEIRRAAEPARGQAPDGACARRSAGRGLLPSLTRTAARPGPDRKLYWMAPVGARSE